jgi:hypothetical protein
MRGWTCGSSMVKRAPPPAAFAAVMVPPSACMILRQIASPRPVPPAPFFVRLDWTNEIETSEGCGTTFRLVFALPGKPANAQRPDSEPPGQARPKSILVVDDDPLLLKSHARTGCSQPAA